MHVYYTYTYIQIKYYTISLSIYLYIYIYIYMLYIYIYIYIQREREIERGRERTTSIISAGGGRRRRGPRGAQEELLEEPFQLLITKLLYNSKVVYTSGGKWDLVPRSHFPPLVNSLLAGGLLALSFHNYSSSSLQSYCKLVTVIANCNSSHIISSIAIIAPQCLVCMHVCHRPTNIDYI